MNARTIRVLRTLVAGSALLLLALGTTLRAADRPNILWLTSEDNQVNWVGCYGNPYAETPNIDALAKEGFLYTHCYANVPVCAPTRCTWITGIHALSMGTEPMRSRYLIPHDLIKYYPDLLKEVGYFVGNAKKTDYNIGGRADLSAWDTTKVDWNMLKQHQPFFMVINNTKSHESKAFGDINHTVHSPQDVRLAKYHPDLLDIRKDYALYHDQVKKMDADIGKALAALKRAGLADNTIVIYNSDHGGVMPRSKRFLFDSGTHSPLVIRIPDKFKSLRPGKPGTKVDRIVSFIDMTKTWLSLCGARIPSYLQGKIFLGPNAEHREYHIAYRTRMDERCDNARAVHDKRFLYVRNYMPYAPWGQHLIYLWKMPAMQAWDAYYRAGKTNAITGRFFHTKPTEELYDTVADPDNIHNLASDPKYAKVLERLRKALDQWQLKIHDAGLLPETEIVRRAEKAGKTIYELVRDPSLYNLKAYQHMAGLTLQNDPANLPEFYRALRDPDSGIRYWAIVGCFNLQQRTPLDMQAIRTCLNDKSDHVRAMAAWIVYRAGDKQTAQRCWNDMLRNDSYASLKILNIIDWIGDGIEPYVDAIKACHYNHGGYVNRMKIYFGLAKPAPRKKKKHKR